MTHSDRFMKFFGQYSICENCGQEVKKSQLIKFILTYKYVCRNCESKYSVSRLSTLLLTGIGMLGIIFSGLVFGVEKYFSIPVAIFIVGILGAFFSPLHKLK